MRLYLGYIKMVFRTVFEYRASFWMMSFGQFIAGFSAFAGMAMLFSRFGALDDWNFGEVALCFGVVNVAGAIGIAFTRGFFAFDQMIINGDFDRMLVRPRTTVIQIMGRHFGFGRVGAFIQSFAVLFLGIHLSGVVWTADKIIILVLMILGGVAIFAGISVISATICFYTTEALEALNILVGGGTDAASYPMTIYSKWMRGFFTFIVPYGCINYLPLMYLTGRAGGNGLLYMLSPLAGFLFLIPASFLWRMGVRKYSSTGA